MQETWVQPLGWEDPLSLWRRERLPTSVFWPGEFHGQSSLAGYSPWGRKELDTTEWLSKMSYKCSFLTVASISTMHLKFYLLCAESNSIWLICYSLLIHIPGESFQQGISLSIHLGIRAKGQAGFEGSRDLGFRIQDVQAPMGRQRWKGMFICDLYRLFTEWEIYCWKQFSFYNSGQRMTFRVR